MGIPENRKKEKKMSTGFGSDVKNANITIDFDYVDVILKQYKKILLRKILILIKLM